MFKASIFIEEYSLFLQQVEPNRDEGLILRFSDWIVEGIQWGELRQCHAQVRYNHSLKNGPQRSNRRSNPMTGYTSNPADAVCARGYAICAPKNLCWTCYDQTLNPKVK